MAETTIEWTATRLPDGRVLPGYTFNPWIGCQAVSAACAFCYAEARSKRYGEGHLWQGERRRTSPANWKLPLRWNREAMRSGIRRRVFCASLADVFDNQVPTDWRNDLWELIAGTRHLDWLLLTKRPQNIAKMLPTPNLFADDRAINPNYLWPWPNVWLGTTVENQDEADRRIPHLLAAPASVRFLSCEPLLGPVDLRSIDPTGEQRKIGASGWSAIWKNNGLGRAWLDWVICGGESGPGARPMHPAWARELRDQCVATGIPYFFKQWGEWAPAALNFGEPGDGLVSRVGKKAAGRLLDGREWNGQPGGQA